MSDRKPTFREVVEAKLAAKQLPIVFMSAPIVEVTGPPQDERPVRPKRHRKPTLVGIARQAAKAEIPVGRYEVRPDGTVIIHTGEPTKSNATDDDVENWLKKHAH